MSKNYYLFMTLGYAVITVLFQADGLKTLSYIACAMMLYNAVVFASKE